MFVLIFVLFLFVCGFFFKLCVKCVVNLRKEMLYLTTNSTYFIYGYMASALT